MDRFIDRIFERSPELAAHLFGPLGVGHGLARPLVVVDANELLETLVLDMVFNSPQEPLGCSPGPGRVFVEFGRLSDFLDPSDVDVHGWLFAGRGPRPGVPERVRASLVVEQHRLIIGPEAVLDLDLDEAGRVIGWPQLPTPRWTTPSSSRRVVGDGHIRWLLYPALVALERLNVEGDSIRAHIPEPNGGRSKRGLPPLFPHVTPSPRTEPPWPSYVTQS
jgi:hypothetical protein